MRTLVALLLLFCSFFPSFSNALQSDNSDLPLAAPNFHEPPIISKNGGITLRWNRVEDAVYYYVDQKDANGEISNFWFGPSEYITVWRQAGIYQFRIKACEKAHCDEGSRVSAYSDWHTVRFLRPLSYVDASFNSDSIAVSWPALPTADIYYVEESQGDDTWQQVYAGPDTQWSTSNLIANRYYQYRVKACFGDVCTSAKQSEKVYSQLNPVTATLQWQPQEIVAGERSELVWKSDNSVECSLNMSGRYDPDGSDWLFSTEPGYYKSHIECFGGDGSSTTAEATLTVKPKEPSGIFRVRPIYERKK